MKRLIAFISVCLLLSGIAYGFIEEENRKTLKGIKDFRLFLNLPKDIEIHEESLRTAIEVKLRMAGIGISSDSDYAFLVAIVPRKIPGGYVLAMHIAVYQLVYLAKDGSVAFANTWDNLAAGTAGSAFEVKELVRDFIDSFINAYLSVNPK